MLEILRFYCLGLPFILLFLLYYFFIYLAAQEDSPIYNRAGYLSWWPPLSCLLCGIWLQAYDQFFSLIFLILIISLLIFSLLIVGAKSSLNKLFFYLCPLFFFSGTLLCMNDQERQKLLQETIGQKNIDIRGRVESKKGGGEECMLKLEKARPFGKKEWEHKSCKLLCFCKTEQNVLVGDYIELDEIIIDVPKPKQGLSGNPEFEKYLLKEGIVGTSRLSEDNKMHLLGRPRFSLARTLALKRDSLYQNLKQKMSPDNFSLFSYIFLGRKPENKEVALETKNLFNLWGVAHYLARAGLHLLMYIYFFGLLLSFIPAPFVIKRLIIISIVITYSALSWSSIPFTRAFLVYLSYEVGRLFYLPTIFGHILTVICYLVLLYNPHQALFLDFQLSFGITLGLSLLSIPKQ